MSELARIMGDDRLARPVRVKGKRDPSPIWDAWYEEFSPADRRYLGRFMGGAVSPDVLATWLGVSTDDALRQWRSACLLEKTGALDVPDDPGWYPFDWPDVLEPADVAELMGCSIHAVHQWQRRRLLPIPGKITRSGVPLWSRREILDWAERTGRVVGACGRGVDVLDLAAAF